MTRFTESSGDVFRDLGFNPSEARELRVRSDLMIRVQEIVRTLPGSQLEIAHRLRTTQPRVSDLLRGKLHLFSLDSLAQMLTNLGVTVSVSVDDFFLNASNTENVPAWRESFVVGCDQTVVTARESRVTSAADTQLALAA